MLDVITHPSPNSNNSLTEYLQSSILINRDTHLCPDPDAGLANLC